MLRHAAAVPIIALSLVACQKQEPTTPPPAAARAVAQQPADTPAAAGSPANDAAAGDAAINGLARTDGYGDLRFGMTADEARKAWGGELRGPVPEDTGACYYLSPIWTKVPADFALMIEGDRFIRYDVGTDKEVAPGGGKRGMRVEDIRALYSGRIEERPHKYVEGGKYLRIMANDGSNGVLVFVADASGKVTSWRVGQAPQADYVEGCA
jgi:hypothetical protein